MTYIDMFLVFKEDAQRRRFRWKRSRGSFTYPFAWVTVPFWQNCLPPSTCCLREQPEGKRRFTSKCTKASNSASPSFGQTDCKCLSHEGAQFNTAQNNRFTKILHFLLFEKNWAERKALRVESESVESESKSRKNFASVESESKSRKNFASVESQFCEIVLARLNLDFFVSLPFTRNRLIAYRIFQTFYAIIRYTRLSSGISSNKRLIVNRRCTWACVSVKLEHYDHCDSLK